MYTIYTNVVLVALLSLQVVINTWTVPLAPTAGILSAAGALQQTNALLAPHVQVEKEEEEEEAITSYFKRQANVAQVYKASSHRNWTQQSLKNWSSSTLKTFLVC
jgi:hypothetical protein